MRLPCFHVLDCCASSELGYWMQAVFIDAGKILSFCLSCSAAQASDIKCKRRRSKLTTKVSVRLSRALYGEHRLCYLIQATFIPLRLFPNSHRIRRWGWKLYSAQTQAKPKEAPRKSALRVVGPFLALPPLGPMRGAFGACHRRETRMKHLDHDDVSIVQS